MEKFWSMEILIAETGRNRETVKTISSILKKMSRCN
jgi:hypothetical protein